MNHETNEMMITPSGDPDLDRLKQAMLDPGADKRDIKMLAIRCGITMPQLLQMYRDNALAESMLHVSDIIASRAHEVVEATLSKAADPDSMAADKKLALELCGIMGTQKQAGPAVNVNVNQATHQPPSFESQAKKATLVINQIPEERV